MPTLSNGYRQPIKLTQTVLMIAAQVMHRLRLRLRSRAALAAETLFLKKQLVLYQEANSRWRCDLNTTRFTLVWLSYWFDWEPALTIVQPKTFKRWRRQGWCLLWKRPSPPEHPSIPPELQALIRRMARENVTWGQQRIANELLLKLGLRVSPRTVRKYMPPDCVGGPGQHCQSQRWSTFICNHVKGLVVTGITAEVTRTAQAMLARVQRLIEHLTQWASQWASRPMKTPNPLMMIHLDISLGIPDVAALNWADSLKGVERSPPEKLSSRPPEPISAAPALLAARVAVRSVIPVRCREALLRSKTPGVASAFSGVIRCDSWPRAADVTRFRRYQIIAHHRGFVAEGEARVRRDPGHRLAAQRVTAGGLARACRCWGYEIAVLV
jgi:hypothetical protein